MTIWIARKHSCHVGWASSDYPFKIVKTFATRKEAADWVKAKRNHPGTCWHYSVGKVALK